MYQVYVSNTPGYSKNKKEKKKKKKVSSQTGSKGDTLDQHYIFLLALYAIGCFDVGNDRAATEDSMISQSDDFRMHFISYIHF